MKNETKEILGGIWKVLTDTAIIALAYGALKALVQLVDVMKDAF